MLPLVVQFDVFGQTPVDEARITVSPEMFPLSAYA
jgi:hypothetical protein